MSLEDYYTVPMRRAAYLHHIVLPYRGCNLCTGIPHLKWCIMHPEAD